MTAELELRAQMNQTELIEKVAQATELNRATAGQAVKAVVNGTTKLYDRRRDHVTAWRR